jgi:hypothetical protein
VEQVKALVGLAEAAEVELAQVEVMVVSVEAQDQKLEDQEEMVLHLL